MSLRIKKPSLADKISSLVTATPTLFGSDDENEESRAKIVENYQETESDDDNTFSTIRKQNVDLLDQIDNRYKGKKVSRKDVYSEESEDEKSEIDEESDNSNENDSNDEKISDEEKDIVTSEDESNVEDNSDSDENEEDYDESPESEIDEDNPLRRDRKNRQDIPMIIPTNARGDVEKGKSVMEQLKIWENLLEMRIKLQKCLIVSNKMPQSKIYEELRTSDKLKKDANDVTNKLGGLLENLLEMQSSLLKNYSETRNLRGEKRKASEMEEKHEDPMDEEISSDTDNEIEEDEIVEEKLPKAKRKKRSLAEYEKILSENHEVYRDYRNSIVQKWNEKTRVASGSANKGSSQAIVRQIDFLLSDKTRLIERTRLKRSEYDILGKDNASKIDNEDNERNQEYDNEIYDDDDFYHQLLRELIEYKSSDITDPVQLSKQWIALQNMRRKMKKKVDTRASKGRKVRYNVHAKLVNFMAPVDTSPWSENAKNELYNSLFGKIQSVNCEDTMNNVKDN